jgi:hypothetical protein
MRTCSTSLGVRGTWSLSARKTVRATVADFERRAVLPRASPSRTGSLFPLMFKFLASTTPVGVKMMTDISNYLDFVLMLFLAFGVAFEVPGRRRAARRDGPRQDRRAHAQPRSM